jgi:hypothetical protein
LALVNEARWLSEKVQLGRKKAQFCVVRHIGMVSHVTHDRTPTHGYEPMCEAAMQAFAGS